ncbi:MAG TPA: COR domain-containing protein, partial [Microthrixaceae bacterium]|nr:COR domain-containing protein [Microthrixaceae bacterium]
GNSIGAEGAAALATLTNLTTLNLRGNGVGDLLPFVPWLRRGIEVHPGEGPDLDLDRRPGIYVGNNPLRTPPMEIVEQGREAVLNYFAERDQQGTAPINEAKVLLVGPGRAGKTSLVTRMYHPDAPLPAEEATTRGIDIEHQRFRLADGADFRINVWDFGGQDIYHATHQFFLTRRSLYILLDDTRTDATNATDDAFAYWLDAIKVLAGGDSPVIIFQNEKGGRSKQLDEDGIKTSYPNVCSVVKADLGQGGSGDAMRDEIKRRVQRLDHVGDPVPAGWVDVRSAIEAKAQTTPLIAEDEYLDLYAEHLGRDIDKARHLSRYLHDLGVFLHFQDDSQLSRIVILSNEWATGAVFAVVDDEPVKAKHGLFDLDDAKRIWAATDYSGHIPEIIALLKKFEFCYQLPGSDDRWLAPQLLPPTRPPDHMIVPEAADLVRTYRYDFLPKGIISRLIVRAHDYLPDPASAWASGAVLRDGEKDGETLVSVSIGGTGTDIELRARGPRSGDLLAAVAGHLDRLNHTYGALVDGGHVHALVPCTCDTCRNATSRTMFDHRKLVKRRNDHKPTIECDASYEQINVLQLLDGIDLRAFGDPDSHRRDGGDGGPGTGDGQAGIHIRAGDNAVVNVGHDATLDLDQHTHAAEPTGPPTPRLPDRLQVWAGACGVIALALVVVFGLGRGWDFATGNTLLRVGGLAALGALAGTALAFIAHALHRA